MPSLSPMETVKESLTTQVRAKYAQVSASEFIQPRILFLRWDYSEYSPELFFRVYEKTDLLLPWTLIGSTVTNSFQIAADKPFGFYTVSAVHDGIEVFSTKP